MALEHAIVIIVAIANYQHESCTGFMLFTGVVVGSPICYDKCAKTFLRILRKSALFHVTVPPHDLSESDHFPSN